MTEAATAAASTAETATAATTTPATTAAFDWNTGIVDEAVKGWVSAKGFKDPAALAQTAYNQEKLLGVPADQIIRMPKDDNPEAWNAIYDKLGRPKDPTEYGLPVPEGDKGEFAATASKWFHEAGLTGKQARAVAEKWNGHVAELVKVQNEATAARDAEQVARLKADWGPQFEANAQQVDAAAKAFGMNAEQLTALKAAMGPAAAMKFMHAIGSKLGVEGEFVSGDGKSGPSGFNTPEAAKAQIKALERDQGFVKRFTTGDVEARAQMRKLHQIAFPGDTVL